MTGTVTGALNFACGTRIRYDDSNPEHRANRLCSTIPSPLVSCPTHGPERANCAVTGPARLLWPSPAERFDVLRDVHRADIDTAA